MAPDGPTLTSHLLSPQHFLPRCCPKRVGLRCCWSRAAAFQLLLCLSNISQGAVPCWPMAMPICSSCSPWDWLMPRNQWGKCFPDLPVPSVCGSVESLHRLGHIQHTLPFNTLSWRVGYPARQLGLNPYFVLPTNALCMPSWLPMAHCAWSSLHCRRAPLVLGYVKTITFNGIPSPCAADHTSQRYYCSFQGCFRKHDQSCLAAGY